MSMTLSEYIKGERGRGAALATALGISPSQLSQIAADATSTAPARCVAIEAATGGMVKRWNLRTEDWHLIWPELIGSEGAPRVKAGLIVSPGYVGPDRRAKARA